jgi:hypothetical protein
VIGDKKDLFVFSYHLSPITYHLSPVMIPFVDLQAQYKSIKAEVDRAIARVLDNTSFILGREVEAFEAAFAEYTGARFCVGVNGGDSPGGDGLRIRRG